jgi:hypothetical protein
VFVVEGTGSALVVVGGAVAGGVMIAVADGEVGDAWSIASSVRPTTKTKVVVSPTARLRRAGEEGMGELPPGGTRRGNHN